MTDLDAEDTLNCIVAIVVLEYCEPMTRLISKICDKLLSTTLENKKEMLKIDMLNTLFLGVPPQAELKVKIYLTIVDLVTRNDCTHQLTLNPDQINEWLSEWNDCTELHRQQIWRTLHRVHMEQRKDKHAATEALLNLLRSYTDHTASHARTDAISCVFSAIQDSSVLVLDHLQLLKPVQVLEGGAVYEFLTIFISGTLEEYDAFLKKQSNFITEHGLDENACRHKMRLLSLLQLCQRSENVFTYDELQTKLQLTSDGQLESFIIEALRLKALSCKLDQAGRSVIVSGSVPRLFGAKQWTSLLDDLTHWERNFDRVRHELADMNISDLTLSNSISAGDDGQAA